MLRDRFTRPVDGASLAFARIVFGLVLLYEACWFLGWFPGAPRDPNLIEYLFTGDHVHWTIPYPGWEWVRPMNGTGMTLVCLALAISGGLVACGWWYRPAMAAATVLFGYLFLCEAAVYLNHFYLAILLGFLFVWMPADRCGRFPFPTRRSTPGSTDVPAWCIILLRGQWLIVYAYAGLAKCNPDWLAGEPLRTWLHHPETAANVTRVAGAAAVPLLRQESVLWTLIYGGLTFDILIGPLLLWRKTRLPALLLLVGFHATNFMLFDIGAFPFFALGMATIFLDPGWPRWWGRRLSRHRTPEHSASRTSEPQATRKAGFLCVCVCSWLVAQGLIPLRHFLITGDVSWTEEGHRYSWHMKLRTKDPGPFYIELADTTLGDTNLGEAAQTSRKMEPARETESSTWRHSQFSQVATERIDWRRLPALVVTYEPVIGERIWLNPLASSDWYRAAARATQECERTFGVRPQWSQTVSLEEALAALARRHRSLPHAVRQDLRLARTQAALLHDRSRDPETRRQASLSLQETLYRLAGQPALRQNLPKALALTNPFAVQGAARSAAPFMVLVDRQVQQPGDDVALRIRHEIVRQEFSVLLDATALVPRAWRPLPQVVVAEQVGGVSRTFWNYARELHDLQTHMLRTSPLVQQQYAAHVAGIWLARHGRRPAVHITSYARLNHHPMQRLTDPRIDLAAERLRPLAHHRWIVDLHRDEQRTRDVALND